MASCEFQSDISRYHDGELDAASRETVESHLASCPICTAELAQLQETSKLFGSALDLRPRLSQMGRHRLKAKVDEAMEDGVLRFARVLSAVAACVLTAGSVWLAANRSPQAVENIQPVAPPWADVSVVADTDSTTGVYTTPAAAWYMADGGGRLDDSQ